MRVSVRVEFLDGVVVDIPVEVSGDANPRYTLGAFGTGAAELMKSVKGVIAGLYGTNQIKGGHHAVTPGFRKGT